ncbi:P18, putative [Acanthamoeba castellanii str. Neff]|uniref:p18, putative n=1 Tax=Acanthamoeba castellanii (strain ATCC 30010 / Neff) TaxID=1257118 RepID=L8GTV2_ACACF|nr:P18, putative [Acanthamoeba castellanii str. Neff]ELR15541.1 P18, putative [Acanthamoeba castellanii str. Neff]
MAAAGPISARPPVVIDREKVCPLLLRVFIKTGGHHRVEDFQARGREPAEEVQIYTWKDATLREMANLVKEVNATARNSRARISFALVFPDHRGRYQMKNVGVVFSAKRSEDDKKTLDSVRFVTGDYLDVAVYVE